MANNCFIEILLETETETEAKELNEMLQTSFAIARRENVGAFFGNDKRYLFDAHCDQAATNVSIGGWVKWGYSDGEFTDMFRWLKSKANINQNHQLSWWYALRLEGDSTGGPTRALNGLPVAFPPRAAAKAAHEFVLLL